MKDKPKSNDKLLYLILATIAIVCIVAIVCTVVLNKNKEEEELDLAYTE